MNNASKSSGNGTGVAQLRGYVWQNDLERMKGRYFGSQFTETTDCACVCARVYRKNKFINLFVLFNYHQSADIAITANIKTKI